MRSSIPMTRIALIREVEELNFNGKDTTHYLTKENDKK